jgi:hypothetical protein
MMGLKEGQFSSDPFGNLVENRGSSGPLQNWCYFRDAPWGVAWGEPYSFPDGEVLSVIDL